MTDPRRSGSGTDPAAAPAAVEHEWRALLDSIVNHTGDFVWAVDLEHRLTWCNDTYRTYVRDFWGVDQCEGLRPSDLVPDPTAARRWDDLYATALRDGTLSVEHELVSGAGVLALTLRVIDRDGEPCGLSVVGRDVTAQRRSERSLVESEARFRSVVMAMAEGVMFLDAAGQINDLNPAAREIMGRTDDEILGRASGDPQWAAVHEDGTPFPEEEHPSIVTLRTGEPRLGVVMGVQRPNGERRWLSINSAPVFTGTTEEAGALPDGVVATFHDITERKQEHDDLMVYAHQVERSMYETLRAVATMVELRDPYTAGHMQRVGAIARDIAVALGWPEERRRLVELAGAVHDIGKIAVPVELLTKPARLRPVEMELVEVHVEWGFEILARISFPLPIAEVVHQHHERIDGTGYPRGLRDDDILPEARVLAAADVLESMASHRPYRPALGVDAALAELRLGAGTRYDTEVVDALEQMIRDEGYLLPATEGVGSTIAF